MAGRTVTAAAAAPAALEAAAAAAAVTLLLLVLPAAAGAATELARVQHTRAADVRVLHRTEGTLRFFRNHHWLLVEPPASRRLTARRAETRARLLGLRARVDLHRREQRLHAMLGYVPGWLCIRRHETPPPFPGWKTNSGNGYYGGVQMDAGFEATYGREFVLKYGGRIVAGVAVGGHAYLWTPAEQMVAAERARRVRGYTPWPTTAPECGL